MYKHVGDAMSYRDLCEAMITVSSNFATKGSALAAEMSRVIYQASQQ